MMSLTPYDVLSKELEETRAKIRELEARFAALQMARDLILDLTNAQHQNPQRNKVELGS